MLAAGHNHVVSVLVEVLTPHKGRVYNPSRGSGRYTTWRLAKMNLAKRGMGGRFAQGNS
jgi:type I restriction-modification system DNA methylase subunit